MMRAVDFASPAARDFRQEAAQLERSGMARIVFRFRREILFSVWRGRAGLGSQILYQGAAQIDIEELATVADGQNRLLFGQGMFQDRAVSGFSSQVRRRRKTLVYGAIFRPLDITGTAQQDSPVQGWKSAVKLNLL